ALQKNGYRTMWAGITDDVELPLDKGLERGFDQIHTLVPQGPDWQNGYQKILPELLDGKPTFLFLHTYAVHAPYLAGPGPRRYMSLPDSTIPLSEDEFYANSGPFYGWVLTQFLTRLAASDTPESKNRNQTILNTLTRALSHNDLKAAQKVSWQFPSYEQYLFYNRWYWKLANLQNPRTVPFVQSLYDERINQLDDTLKPLLDFVSRPDVKRKTIVIFTSDHGEEFMEHGFMEHDSNLYKTSTHVPFIAAIPHIESGVRDGLAQSIDIYPTLLQLVGIKPMGTLEGQSLVSALTDTTGTKGDTYLVSEHRGSILRSIQDGTWKLYLHNPPDRQPWTELFNLLTDPNETYNSAGAHPAVVEKLSATLTTILKNSPKFEPIESEFPAWIDSQRRQHLIEHGYF
ncbi:sulfatase-like hydrolase/transferase, partial [Candidatus Gottesmanbacteria bacterium]|nr:sulfatase-like hydrolase/transferase [Candidatus Gottesmanbacteria bacterium]